MKNNKILVMALTLGLFTSLSAFAQKGNSTPEKIFKKLDANKDEYLTMVELEGKGISKQFKKIDTDEDEQISLEEFKAFKAKNAEKAKKKKNKE
ncbi:EF-hand domain-containing protein [Flavivirga amylovorans]|uniref:EF-hand domain-containing protein n=1 Tax=Flavivirga amylovorans TaxID=870486 RepID=A0ABT8X6Y8_9FLAO|nr:EF-hand domain-containing protein [Flavivirga amylovorans]MDO5989771.1 EF-hand domain-containing protein [Flavivirga amylovorans]